MKAHRLNIRVHASSFALLIRIAAASDRDALAAIHLLFLCHRHKPGLILILS